MSTKELAKKCRQAVFKQVEEDRCLNGENIDLAIEKEIAVAQPEPKQLALNKIGTLPSAQSTAEIVTYAQDLISEIQYQVNRGATIPSGIRSVATALEKVIRNAGF